MLRPYQAEMITRARLALASGDRRVIFRLPTGGGKTVVMAEMVLGAVSKGKRVLACAHRQELVGQLSRKLADLGIQHGVLMPGHRPDRTQPVQVASVATLAHRELPPADLLMLDEGHHSVSPSWLRLINAYPESVVCCFTATPIRQDNKPLGAIYQRIIVGPTEAQLIAQGYLVRPRVFAPDSPDLAGVHRVMGDYHQGELAAAMDKPKLVGDVVATWQRLAAGRRTLAYATNVQHSHHIVQAFNAAGIPAAHVDGNTPADERRQALVDLHARRLLVVSNVALFTEGTDLPWLEAISLCRPTLSVGLYLQIVGRAARTAEGKTDALLLDHAGATLTHGFFEDDRDFELQAKFKPRGVDLKNCPSCLLVVLATTARCPECGWAFGDDAKPRKVRKLQGDGELAELTPVQLKEAKRQHIERLRSEAQLMAYDMGWVRHQFKTKWGHWPTNYLTPEEREESTRRFWERQNAAGGAR